jgi:hypothetical protein
MLIEEQADVYAFLTKALGVASSDRGDADAPRAAAALPLVRHRAALRRLVPHARALRRLRPALRARAGYFLGSIYINYGVASSWRSGSTC